MYDHIACMNVTAPMSCNALGGLMRESDPLELELLMVVSCTAGAGSEPRFSARAASPLNY